MCSRPHKICICTAVNWLEPLSFLYQLPLEIPSLSAIKVCVIPLLRTFSLSSSTFVIPSPPFFITIYGGCQSTTDYIILHRSLCVNNFFILLIFKTILYILWYRKGRAETHERDTQMDIGERIRRRREELGLSQSELARRVGYTSRSTINKIEKDAHGISQEKIVAIAKALRTTPSYLMGWEDEEVASLTAMQEETMAKFLLLSYEHQLVVSNIIDTLSEQEKG